MASFNFYLQQPYKQSDKVNPEEAKKENRQIQDQVRQLKRTHDGNSGQTDHPIPI